MELLRERRSVIQFVDSWDDLQSADRGPVCLPNGIIVDRDKRLVNQDWVPWELVHDSRWTLLTSIHASTFNPLSLPSGWGSWGGGTLTVAGGEILITATPGVERNLQYTPALGATDWVRVICRGYAKSVEPGSANNYCGFILYMNTALDRYVFYKADVSDTDVSYFAGAAYSRSFGAITTLQTLDLALNPGGVTKEYISGIRVLSSTDCFLNSTFDGTLWSSPAASDGINLYASTLGGGVGNTVFAIEHAAIYKGEI